MKEARMHKKNHMVPRKLPCQERSRATVAAIYEAAAQVFTKNGYYSTTTDMIAERAGVSIGTLYQYFPSKDAILVGLWENHFLQGRALVEDVIREMEQIPFLDKGIIAQLIRRVILVNMENKAQHRLFVSDIPWPQAVIEKEIELGRFIKSYIEDVFRKNPSLRIKNSRIAAHVAYETVYSLVHEYILYWTKEISLDEFIQELADMICRYMFTGDERIVWTHQLPDQCVQG
jgi:AcrR family transcriptional regulator